jgi:hypothetical protein
LISKGKGISSEDRARAGIEVIFRNIRNMELYDVKCTEDKNKLVFTGMKQLNFTTCSKTYKSFIIPEIRLLAEKILLDEEQMELTLNFTQGDPNWSWTLTMEKM